MLVILYFILDALNAVDPIFKELGYVKENKNSKTLNDVSTNKTLTKSGLTSTTGINLNAFRFDDSDDNDNENNQQLNEEY